MAFWDKFKKASVPQETVGRIGGTSPEAAVSTFETRKRSKIRVPLRVQITALLVFFVLSVAVVSFESTFAILEQDKIGAIRELQTMKAADFSRDLGEHINHARLELRENSLRLLDPERGALQVDAKNWRWIRVEGKVWKNPDFSTEKILPVDHEFFKNNEKNYFRAQVRSTDPDDLIIQDSLRVVQDNKEKVFLMEAQISKALVISDVSRMSSGPIRGLVLDGGSLTREKLNSEADVKRLLWGGLPDAVSAFSPLALAIPTLIETLALISPPTSRVFTNPLDQSKFLVSWSTVALTGTEVNLVAITFANQSEILKAFLRKKVELAFWIFLVIGFGVIAASVLGTRVSKPIESIVSAASILEKGDFRVRVDQSRGDELGDLGAAFNHMGATLEQRDLELQAANSALIQNEKLAALGTLSAGLAHEVKNPLAGILGHADMTSLAIKKMGIPNQEVLLKHIETIQKETKRCRGIIDNLMKFSRNDGGKTVTEFEIMDLELCAWDSIALNEHPLNLAKVKIEKHFSKDLWLLRGNPNQVEQVILNMMQNAGHAMPKGGVIRIGTEYYADAAAAPIGQMQALTSSDFKGPIVRIYISDSGAGMSPQVMKRIFEPFFTTKPKGVGTGLGLSVTTQILADHKARLSLSSELNKGSTFYIDFMAVKPRTPEILAQIKEVQYHRAGGTQLTTDVSTAKPVVTTQTNTALSRPPGTRPMTLSKIVKPPVEKLLSVPIAPVEEVELSGDFGGHSESSQSTGTFASKTQANFKVPQVKLKTNPAAPLTVGTQTSFVVSKPKVKS